MSAMGGKRTQVAHGREGVLTLTPRAALKQVEPRLTPAFRCSSSTGPYDFRTTLLKSHIEGEFRAGCQVVDGCRSGGCNDAVGDRLGAAGPDRQHFGNGEHAARAGQHRGILANAS